MSISDYSKTLNTLCSSNIDRSVSEISNDLYQLFGGMGVLRDFIINHLAYKLIEDIHKNDVVNLYSCKVDRKYYVEPEHQNYSDNGKTVLKIVYYCNYIRYDKVITISQLLSHWREHKLHNVLGV